MDIPSMLQVCAVTALVHVTWGTNDSSDEISSFDSLWSCLITLLLVLFTHGIRSCLSQPHHVVVNNFSGADNTGGSSSAEHFKPQSVQPPQPDEGKPTENFTKRQNNQQRSVRTQSMVTYKRKWVNARFQPCPNDDGGWSE